jgi:hypothetical protein
MQGCGSGENSSRGPVSRGLRSQGIALETTAIVHSFRFFARLLLLGGFAVAVLVFGSLLHGELARAWASDLRRLVTRKSG